MPFVECFFQNTEYFFTKQYLIWSTSNEQDILFNSLGKFLFIDNRIFIFYYERKAHSLKLRVVYLTNIEFPSNVLVRIHYLRQWGNIIFQIY